VFGAAELHKHLVAELRDFAQRDVLELGSGTGAFSPDGFAALTVTDVNQAYLDQIHVPCKKFLASAAALPFENKCFDLVFAVGLYHHISDEDYLKSMQEINRVLRAGGTFVNLDNLPPTRSYRVIAAAVRRMDRGHFVRTIPKQQVLMQTEFLIEESRTGTYSWCGLEYVIHRCRKAV
jgi:SAM-dependent methyltransferase